MESIKMPKDLDDIKSRVIGGLTLRQVLCFIAAVGTVVTVLVYIRPLIPGKLSLLLCIGTAAPLLAMGFIPKDELQGLYPEQFAIMMLEYNVLRPVVRKYKTVNFYDTLRNEILEDEKREKQLNQKKLTRKEERERKRFNASIKGVR